jgi:hypothetical protein
MLRAGLVRGHFLRFDDLQVQDGDAVEHRNQQKRDL